MSDGRMIFEREREDLARIVKLILQERIQMSQEATFHLKRQINMEKNTLL